MTKRILILVLSSSLVGCSIRMTANLETGDAVYGKTKMEKEQEYDAQTNRKLSVVEAIAGTINSDVLLRRDPEPVPTPYLP